MNESLFLQYVMKYFPTLVLRTVERLNGKDAQLTYLFKKLLNTQYSVDGRWATVIGEYTRVAADLVAMDSSLPLKSRDTLEKASGNIPKMGMEMWLNEKQMSDIDAMIALGLPEEDIIAKILADTPRVIEGIYERLELMFLQGLSNGVTLMNTGQAVGDNIGTGVRVDYGYLPANQFGVENLDFSKIIDDITRVKTKATNDGNGILHAYTDTATFNKMILSEQFKQQFAFNRGFVGSDIPTPTIEQANSVFSELFGFTLTKVDRIVKTERDGIKTNVTPWKQGTIVFTSDLQVGSLVWTRLAEMNRPAKHVTYQTADQYILVSKYHTTRPSFAEFTTSQARVLPVISNVDRIYTLDTKIVEA